MTQFISSTQRPPPVHHQPTCFPGFVSSSLCVPPLFIAPHFLFYHQNLLKILYNQGRFVQKPESEKCLMFWFDLEFSRNSLFYNLKPSFCWLFLLFCFLGGSCAACQHCVTLRRCCRPSPPCWLNFRQMIPLRKSACVSSFNDGLQRNLRLPERRVQPRARQQTERTVMGFQPNKCLTGRTHVSDHMLFVFDYCLTNFK